MARELFIVGTQGLAKEAAQLARRLDPDGQHWSTIHYATHERALLGQPRPFGSVDTLDEQLEDRREPADVVLGTGRPDARQRIVARLRPNTNLHFPNLIHPSVEIDPQWVRVGMGNMITLGVVMTCDIELGDFNLLNWNVTVGHDSRIGCCNVVNPGSSVSGNVVIGDGCLIGTGARILEGRTLADSVTLGAGAVLTRSASVAGGTYVGVPARLLSS